MINKVILVGDVWKDPEERTTKKEGLSMCILSVVTKEFIKNNNVPSGSDNSYSEKKEWHTIVSFGDTATYILEKIRKGDIVYVEGQIQTREMVDGEKKTYTREIIINRSGLVKKIFSKKRDSMELVSGMDDESFGTSKKQSLGINKKTIDEDDHSDDDEDLLF